MRRIAKPFLAPDKEADSDLPLGWVADWSVLGVWWPMPMAKGRER